MWTYLLGGHHSAHDTLSQQTFIYGRSSQPGMILPPRDILLVSGDIFVVTRRWRDAASILLIEAKDIAKYPTMHRTDL